MKESLPPRNRIRVLPIVLLAAAFSAVVPADTFSWSNETSVATNANLPRDEIAPTVSAKLLAEVTIASRMLRRPIASARWDDDTVVVANQRSGTVSFVSVDEMAVRREVEVGGNLSDLACVQVEGKPHLLLTDDKAHRLFCVRVTDEAATMVWQLEMPTGPTSLVLSPDNHSCVVASSWARTLTWVELPAAVGDSAKIRESLDLPFSPKAQFLFADQKRLLVADAFGPRLALIATDTRTLLSIREIPGNNIRGLTRNQGGDKLYVTHELINEIAPPRSSEIIWGSMVSDAMREIPVATILDPEASLSQGSRFLALGNNTRGAGDPNGLASRSDGRLIVAIGGLGQIGVVEPGGIGVTRLQTGKRPTHVLAWSDNRFLITNQNSDSLSRVDFDWKENTNVDVIGTDDSEFGGADETPADYEDSADRTSYSEKGEAEYEYAGVDESFDESRSGEEGESSEGSDGYDQEKTETEYDVEAAYDVENQYAETEYDDREAYASDVSRNGLTYQTKTYQIGPDADKGAKQLVATVQQMSLGLPPKLTPSERGETLFFDASLSRGGWYSCHSCHTDGHTSGSLADTLSDGGEGAPKRILSLHGVGQTGPWAWIGDKSEIESQVRQTLRLTMQGRKLNGGEIGDLVAFLKSLPPAPTFRPASDDADAKIVDAGRELFQSLDCIACHSGSVLTSEDTYEVGLTDERGTTQFNPPSLRGVGHLHSLFHDLRAADLNAVVTQYKHQLPRDLTLDEQEALIRYLQSL
ncbi:methylamine utilization protein MauG [Rhodopirellula sp. JC740]|uniref:Methylamine utilization protein MauG n=1 Tax=Rhodopirellula halodulae TaxID=2894198 RepID=A0ABS8NNJ5_9BACT|nr:cytochrome c peroxidase [Rhodopirellula sp. JC740]MCC9645164.1 methylamine utilization protein MauG [Rhodopirellula sp. JC740]